MSEFIVPISSLPTVSSLTDTKSAQGAQGAAIGDAPFANILQDAIENLTATGEKAQQNTHTLALGGSDDMHTGAIDAIKYASAVSFASGLTNSAIRAYNELMRMQI